MKLDEKYRSSGGSLPPTLFIQLDSASDNKANALLAFMTYLIEEGVFNDISCNFLIVGHTHEGDNVYLYIQLILVFELIVYMCSIYRYIRCGPVLSSYFQAVQTASALAKGLSCRLMILRSR